MPADSLTAPRTTQSLLDAPRLSLAEAARKLGVHVSAIHRWRLTGCRGRKLRVVRIGGRSYILVADLEAWIAAQSDPPIEEDRDEDYQQRVAAAELRAAAMGL